MRRFSIIYEIVKRIPYGRLMTYKQISQLANISDIRIVGYALHRNLDPINIPCHRVVKQNGKIASGYAFGGKNKQIELLKKEQISFANNTIIDLPKYICRIPLWLKMCFYLMRLKFFLNEFKKNNY